MIMGLTLGAMFKLACGFVFDNPIGKMVAGGLLAVTVFGSWLLIRDHKVATAAKTEIITKTNEKAQEITDAGLKAREGADTPGAVDRLRRNHCRDC